MTILSPHLMQSLAKSPAATARLKWLASARPAQVTPAGDWRAWLVLAGRGFGKTRLGAEDIAWYAMTHDKHQIAVVAPTFNDVRGTCFEGVSGLLSVIPQEEIAEYNKSILQITLNNGAVIRGFSADTPNRLRGPQFHRAWCDELAAWQYPEAWDQLMFGLRLGQNPRVIITTTPRPTPLVRKLAKDGKTLITKGSTFDNAANLAPEAIEALRETYEGTRLGRQELYAEILDDVEGALWSRDMIHIGHMPEMQRIVVGVDPSGGGDDIGIIVAGRGVDGLFYVIEDGTCNLSPSGWARRVDDLFSRNDADIVVAERNFGGDMVKSTLRTANQLLPVKMVTASRGKAVRAEPIAALYEQGKVRHNAGLGKLEDQMMQFTLSGYVGEGSPDRVDALVWAMSELSAGGQKTKAKQGAVIGLW